MVPHLEHLYKKRIDRISFGNTMAYIQYSDLYFWGSLYQILLPAFELAATLYVIYFSRTPSWNLIRAVLDRKIQSNSYSRAIHTDPNYIENVEGQKVSLFSNRM